MSEYDNSNRFSLWLNDKRETQKHPHLSGQGETTEPVWCSAWFAQDLSDDDKRALLDIVKRHRQVSKRPFVSVSIKAKDEARQETPSEELNDEIPFWS